MTSFSKSDRSGIVYDNAQVTLGALANGAAALQASKIDSARENGFRVLKTQWWVQWRFPTASEGPVMFGLAIGVDADAVATIIQADPQSAGSNAIIDNTQTKRPLWPLAMLHAEDTDARHLHDKGEVMPRWSVQEDQTMQWWGFNVSGSTLTTGSQLKFFAKHFGVWLRD